jgi:hypothetical protein
MFGEPPSQRSTAGFYKLTLKTCEHIISVLDLTIGRKPQSSYASLLLASVMFLF